MLCLTDRGRLRALGQIFVSVNVKTKAVQRDRLDQTAPNTGIDLNRVGLTDQSLRLTRKPSRGLPAAKRWQGRRLQRLVETDAGDNSK